MCIVLMQLHHPDFALIIASNRDEFLLRPTAPSHWHSFPSPTEFEKISDEKPSLAHYRKDNQNYGQIDPNGARPGSNSSRPSSQRPILSGIDAHPSGGGTWIGISKSGKLAILTNFTELKPPPLPQGRGIDVYRSRGKLTKDWLLTEGTETSLDQFLKSIEDHKDEWPGFNFMAGELFPRKQGSPRIGYVSNRTKVDEGIYYLPSIGDKTPSIGLACDGNNNGRTTSGCPSIGLSNSELQEPWSKVIQGRQLFEEAISKYDERKSNKGDGDEAQLAKDLFNVLATSPGEVKDRSDLPRSICVTPQLRHPQLGWYATRTSTVLLVHRNGRTTKASYPMQWWERDIHIIDKDGNIQRSDMENERHYTAELTPDSYSPV